MGIIEKIKEIEAEMARTQKNKATGTQLVSSDFIRLVEFPKKVLLFFAGCFVFSLTFLNNSLALWSNLGSDYFLRLCVFSIFVIMNVLWFLYRAEYHLGQLKAKIAKLRTQLLEPPKVRFYNYCLYRIMVLHLIWFTIQNNMILILYILALDIRYLTYFWIVRSILLFVD